MVDVSDALREDCACEIVQEGETWKVTVIKAGRSLNGNLYTPEVLKAAAPLFEGRPLQAFDVADGIMGHLPLKVRQFLRGGLLKATVGFLRNPQWDEASGSIVAEAVLTSPWLVKILRGISEAAAGPIRTLGLSISAAAEAEPDGEGRTVKALRWVDSVDVVTTPAAGGQFTRALEALINEETSDMSDQNAQTVDVAAAIAAAQAEADKKLAALREELAAERKRAMIHRVVESVAGSLNESVKVTLAKSVADLDDEDAIRKAAQTFMDGLPKPSAKISAGRAPEDKMQAALNGLVGVAEGTEAEVPAFRGLREAYIEWTGDRDLTQIAESTYGADQTSTSPFTVGMGTALHRRLRKAYANADFGAMKLVSTIQAVNDFKTHNIIGIGGFGGLTTVAEETIYTALTVPAEEYATLAVTKKGNIIAVTWESIVNDDLGITLRHTDRLGLAAKRTLEAAIFALFTANSGQGATLTIDSNAWFKSDSAHGNYGTTALGYASILASEALIAAQTEATSGYKLGIEPSQGGYVIGHRALRSTWNELTRGSLKPGTANNDGNALAWSPDQFVVDPFTSDQTNWYMQANPQQWEAIVLAFLFGKQEPELLVADAANAYAMWTADCIEYKVRHVWGLSVVDYRTAAGHVVA